MRTRRSYVRRVVLATVWASLVLGLLPAGGALAGAPDGQAIAANAASAWWPNVRPATGTQLADLEIVGSDGRPLEDSVVIASLWPKSEIRDALKPGDHFSPVPVDRASVAGGRAKIHIDDDKLLQAHTSTGGDVKIQLDVFTPEGRTILFLQDRRDQAGRWSGGAGASLATDVAARRAADSSAVTRFNLDPDLISPADLPPEAVVAPLENRNHQDQWGCSEWDVDPNVTVAETIATVGAYKGVKVDVTYATSAGTVSELGFQGANGTWKINGSMSRSSTLEADYLQVIGSTTAWTNKEYRAGWTHHRYWHHCPLWENGIYNFKYYTERTTEPYKVSSFPAISNSRYSLPGCVAQHDLSGVASVSTSTHTATSYSAAFAISYGGATFSGGARSDYSASVKIKFSRPTGATSWYWCGDAYVPQDSYRVRSGR